MAEKRKSPPRQPKFKTSGCKFCKEKTMPDYKNYEVLDKFMSDRAKISGRDRSGLCAKHQRQLAAAVKRARHLALLPFTGRV